MSIISKPFRSSPRHDSAEQHDKVPVIICLCILVRFGGSLCKVTAAPKGCASIPLVPKQLTEDQTHFPNQFTRQSGKNRKVSSCNKRILVTPI